MRPGLKMKSRTQGTEPAAMIGSSSPHPQPLPKPSPSLPTTPLPHVPSPGRAPSRVLGRARALTELRAPHGVPAPGLRLWGPPGPRPGCALPSASRRCICAGRALSGSLLPWAAARLPLGTRLPRALSSAQSFLPSSVTRRRAGPSGTLTSAPARGGPTVTEVSGTPCGGHEGPSGWAQTLPRRPSAQRPSLEARSPRCSSRPPGGLWLLFLRGEEDGCAGDREPRGREAPARWPHGRR